MRICGGDTGKALPSNPYQMSISSISCRNGCPLTASVVQPAIYLVLKPSPCSGSPPQPSLLSGTGAGAGVEGAPPRARLDNDPCEANAGSSFPMFRGSLIRLGVKPPITQSG